VIDWYHWSNNLVFKFFPFSTAENKFIGLWAIEELRLVLGAWCKLVTHRVESLQSRYMNLQFT
jgi:hypothetical protein